MLMHRPNKLVKSLKSYKKALEVNKSKQRTPRKPSTKQMKQLIRQLKNRPKLMKL